MSEKVKRYDPEGYSLPASISGIGTHMVEHAQGDYVLAADFDVMALRCMDLEATQYGAGRLQALRDERNTLRAEIADLKAALLEAERGAEELVRLRAERRDLAERIQQIVTHPHESKEALAWRVRQVIEVSQ